ncbi:peptidylprolyl isomerase [Aliiglaciecola litoralis]
MSLTNTSSITVNGHVIPAAAIDAEIQYHPAETRRQAMIKAAETLIIGELLAQKAVEKGLLNDADRTVIEDQPALVDALLDQEVAIPHATDEECRRYFEANTATFTTSPLVEVSHILLAADPKDLEHRAETHALALKIIDQLTRNQASFVEMAKAYSVCPSKEVGGSLGQISNGQTVSEFERQVFASDVGLMPTPVESRYGYHVVLIARKVPGKPLTYDLVKEKIQTYLNDRVQRKAISQYLHRMVSDANIIGFHFDIEASPLVQ